MGKLNDTEKIQLVTDFNNGFDLNFLSEKYGIRRSSVRGLLLRRGFNLPNASERLLTVKEKVNILEYTGRNQVKKILQHLYLDSEIYLKRKYDLHKKIKNE